MSPSHKAASAVGWAAFSQFGRQILQLLTTIALARILLPEDFGLVGMATVFVAFGLMFKDFGTAAALIQRQKLETGLTSTIFWTNLIFGFLITGIFYLTAPWIADFYGDDRVTGIVRGFSLVLLLATPAVVPTALLERQLNFKAVATSETIAVVVGAAVGVGSALLGQGAWSLVWQMLTTTSMTTALIISQCSWRPSWQYSVNDLRSVLGYSGYIVGFNFFNFFCRNADNVLIGRFLGADLLGIYSFAYRVMLFPISNITQVLCRVLFPVLSSKQQNLEALRRAYLRTIQAISLVSFPIMVGLIFIAKPFVLVLLGEKWNALIPLLVILAPVGLLQSIGATVGPIYLAIGKTDVMLKWGVFSGFLIVIGFVIGLQWGIQGVAIGYLSAALILFIPGLIIPYRLIGLTLDRAISVMIWPFTGVLVMGGALVLLKMILPATNSILELIITVAAGCSIYGCFQWIVNRQFLVWVYQTVIKDKLTHA